MNIALGIIAMFIVGVFMGYIISRHNSHKEYVGTLRIDNSDPEDGPYLFLELSSNPNTLKQFNYVILKVDARNYISQK